MNAHRAAGRGRLAASLAAAAVLGVGLSRAAPVHAVGGSQAVSPPAGQTYPDTPGTRAFASGLRLLGLGDREAARQQFETALRFATDTDDRFLEAGCRRSFGIIATQEGRHADALVAHQQALALFQALPDRLNAADSHVDVGRAEYWLGRRDDARGSWLIALAEFRSLGAGARQASVLYNLSFVAPDPHEKRAWLDEALPLAQAAANRTLEGQVFAARSDGAFVAGQYRDAFADIGQAITLLADVGAAAEASLARALTSLGRIYRAHAQFDRAIAAYQRALDIQVRLGDRQGEAQSLRAIAVAYHGLGRLDVRRRYLERSLEAIRTTDAVDEQRFAEVHLASCLIDAGDVPGAFRLLDPIAATDWGLGSEWTQNTLARAHVAAGDPAKAIDPATRAVVLSRRADDAERLFYALLVRGEASMALGRYREASSDTREALGVVERLRQQLVPHDYMKRGFMDRFQSTIGMALASLDRLGQPADAMEMAERGRARAFADLLLARQVSRRPEPMPAATAVGSPHGEVADRQQERADDLPSDASAPSATIDDLRRLAGTLDVTILTYWVGRDVTWAWLMRPGGEVVSHRVAVRDDQLRDLVSRVWRSMRGHEPRRATRELHRLLVAPLRHAMPQAPGSRLLVIPHGPLAALSFAALQDARGRYLIEHYTLIYVPAASVLTIDAWHAPSPRADASYLLVGAPGTLPGRSGGEALGPLPGARRELMAIEQTVGPTRARRLTGRAASEVAVRRDVAGVHVLHFATHGVMFDEAPLDSYLALDATSTTGAASGDGRLTAREVYDLDLQADLVVLSACRSGLGRLSGDGLSGLARAFFYAGARSVVATLWDVADEPAARLTTHFHARLARGAGVSDALRDAQLALLRDLRAGRVVAQGRRGPVPLPEHPALWAGFVLFGRP